MLLPGRYGCDHDILRTDTGSSSLGAARRGQGLGSPRESSVSCHAQRAWFIEERGGGQGRVPHTLTLVWKQKMVTEMDTTAVMIIAMMTALVSYTLKGRRSPERPKR